MMLSYKKKKFNAQDTSFTFLENTKIIFATEAEGAQLLGVSDAFTSVLSDVDVSIRLKDANKTQENDYLRYATAQAQTWTEKEKEKVFDVFKIVEKRIEKLGMNLSFSMDIKVIKSTMQEEGGASGYTRSNLLVLKAVPSDDLLAHELFHIYSRLNPDKRDELYQTINFEKCNRIELPASLQKIKLTNPDAPFMEHILTIQKNGQSLEVAFMIYSPSESYDAGTFSAYLKKQLLVVEGTTTNKLVKMINDEPLVLEYEAADNLRTLIGRNTGYDIHPEEVLADHFKLLVNAREVPEKKYLEAMLAVLK